MIHRKNIEAACSTEAEIRAQIRLEVIRKFGHYFGTDEEPLKDVHSYVGISCPPTGGVAVQILPPLETGLFRRYGASNYATDC